MPDKTPHAASEAEIEAAMDEMISLANKLNELCARIDVPFGIKITRFENEDDSVQAVLTDVQLEFVKEAYLQMNFTRIQ